MIELIAKAKNGKCASYSNKGIRIYGEIAAPILPTAQLLPNPKVLLEVWNISVEYGYSIAQHSFIKNLAKKYGQEA